MNLVSTQFRPKNLFYNENHYVISDNVLNICSNKITLMLQVSMYAGALFIQLALGWDMYLSVGVLLAVTAVYTVLGERNNTCNQTIS